MPRELIHRALQRENGERAASDKPHSGLTYSPRIDLWETDDELVLQADVPGVAAEHLDVQFAQDELRIHGQVSPRHGDLRFLYGEYGVGDFYRTFTIGEAIDSQKISAELKDGVLTLHLPKTAAVKPRRIEVQTS